MAGQLIYVVGPSGSGKDSILRELELDLPPACLIMQRAITRITPPTTEKAQYLTVQEFESIERQGGFSLSWRANGLAYGVDKELDRWLALGKQVLVNGSREYWPQVYQRYPEAKLVIIDVGFSQLEQRLVLRARESLGKIQARLARHVEIDAQLKEHIKQTQPHYWIIDNSGDLQMAVQQLRQCLLSNRIQA